jgi:hypothetical protein
MEISKVSQMLENLKKFWQKIILATMEVMNMQILKRQLYRMVQDKEIKIIQIDR